MSGRHRAAHRLGRFALPAAAAFTLWLADNDPAGPLGLAGFTALAVALGVLYPVLLILALQAPGSLVPCAWRAWRRRGHEGRPHIPDWLRRAVYAADSRRCCFCGYAGSLQLDHVRPWSFGGRTSLFNLITLCQTCNVVKSNYWMTRNGTTFYRPFKGASNVKKAAAILAAERRHRLNPVRWVRAGMAL